MTATSPFASLPHFRDTFNDSLGRLLREYDELGAFILVLANAAFDPQVGELLAAPLSRKFHRFAAALRGRHPCGLVLDDAGDDYEVFVRLMAIGFDGLPPVEQRQAGDWELQFNRLRSFRPPRLAGGRVAGITAPFNPDGFHFDKPFLRKEIFWSGWLCGRNAALFYNKYPFVPLHGILVPEPRQRRAQLLEQDDHDYLWRVSQTLAETLPGVGLGYNSFGSFASVNHFHVQTFIREHPLPVALGRWRHNGGTDSYPAECFRFDGPGPAWACLQELHRAQRPYNLIYLPGVIYCLPRAPQGEYPVPGWSGGFAWYEMAGGFSVAEREAYQLLDDATLRREMAVAAGMKK
jgi:hypothetical protein